MQVCTFISASNLKDSHSSSFTIDNDLIVKFAVLASIYFFSNFALLMRLLLGFSIYDMVQQL